VDMSKTLSVGDVARQLRLHNETVLRWIHTGRLRAKKLGGRYRIRQEDVDALPKPVVPVHAPTTGAEQPPLCETSPAALERLRARRIIR
jgi:excisionase family DNA binding protein